MGHVAKCPVLHGFDPLRPDAVEDPYPWLAAARAEAPVFYLPEYELWCVTRYADVATVLRDPTTFSSAPTADSLPIPTEVADLLPQGWPFQPNIGSLDPPAHTRLRKLAQKGFTASQAGAQAGAIAELAHQAIDMFVERGSVDLVPAYCQKIPVQVVAPVFGVPLDMCPLLHRWAVETTQLLGNRRLAREELVELARNQARFDGYVRELVAERRRSPRDDDDLLTALIFATGDDGEPMLSDAELVSLTLAGIAAGSETSATTIGHAVDLLLRHGLWTDVATDESLAANAVEETLRVQSSSRGVFRRSTRAASVGGVELPAGSLLYLSLASAGRDEDVFSLPDEFDLSRANAKQHFGFGFGTHFCLGAPLSRVQVRVALEVLAARIPTLRLAPGHRLVHLPSLRVPALLRGLEVVWG